MSVYIIDSIKFPIELVIAPNRREALKQYAEHCGFNSIEELEEECKQSFGLQAYDKIDMVDVDCISHALN